MINVECVRSKTLLRISTMFSRGASLCSHTSGIFLGIFLYNELIKPGGIYEFELVVCLSLDIGSQNHWKTKDAFITFIFFIFFYPNLASGSKSNYVGIERRFANILFLGGCKWNVLLLYHLYSCFYFVLLLYLHLTCYFRVLWEMGIGFEISLGNKLRCCSISKG